MKLFKHFFLTILMVSSLVACKSDDDAGDSGAAADGTITATVSGADFTSNVASTSAMIQSANGSQTLLVTGSDLGGKNITFTLNGYDGTGTYNIGGENMVFVTAIYTEVNPSNPQNAQIWSAPYPDSGIAGELNITEASATNIKGTFFFDGQNNNDNSIKNITAGSFSINL